MLEYRRTLCETLYMLAYTYICKYDMFATMHVSIDRPIYVLNISLNRVTVFVLKKRLNTCILTHGFLFFLDHIELTYKKHLQLKENS